ncbi:peptidylprolyl isomerase [Novosphingobium sp. BL-8H]|uniref:peptidylprolyl isomerase n=1 Tax=Novosphingobium sp. BL-8H TaxID=3127640 RepID=UPI003757DF3D
MSRSPDVIDVTAAPSRLAVMPSACQSGGCGCSNPAMPPPPSFGEVFVNGVEITAEAIAEEIQHHPAPDAETAWTEAARALAVRELLLQEAARLGITAAGDSDETGRRETDDEAVIRILLEREVMPEGAGEPECRRYYDANPARFRTPDLFDAAHILIEPEADEPAQWAAAEAFARALIAEVRNDHAAFAQAARRDSACASAQQDGSLGQVRRGELVREVQQAIEALKDGETGQEPVRSRFGWHVVRLNRRIAGQILPFDVVREKIADMLEARSWSMSAAHYVSSLAAQGQVEGIIVAGIEG